MTNTNLTDNEIRATYALINSCLEGMGGKHINDLDGDPYTWVAASDLVAAGWAQKQAEGTFGSLVSKGVIDDCGEGDYAINYEDFKDMWVEMDTDPAPSIPAIDDVVGQFAAYYKELRDEGKSRSKSLRTMAASFTGTRKEFVQAAEKMGINTNTAKTMWQSGRA